MVTATIYQNCFPFTKHLASIVKKYFGIVSEKLYDLDIDRAFYALIVIAESGNNITQQMLAKKLETDKVSMVRTIDYLSRKGYVKRRKNPADRREHLLEVTSKGNTILPQIRQAFLETNQEAFQGLNDAEIDSFFNCLYTIKNNLIDIKTIDVQLKINRFGKKTKSERSTV